MSGALVGLLLGMGLVLVLLPPSARASRTARPGAVRRRLDAAGLPDVAPVRLVLTCAGAGAAGLVLMLVVSGSVVVASTFGVLASALPALALGRRASARRRARTGVWPDAVDDLASAVRAGMSLPEAVSALAERGPSALRPAVARFAAEHRVTGAFGPSLDHLKAELADPVGDRVIEALRLAREVGGTELGRLLRTLSAVLREDARTRAELEARQAWAVNAARLAVAAPWATLALLSMRPGAVSAYDSAAGALVLAIAGVLSAVAYVVMRRIGRLPVDERVLA
ncbi:MAG: type II secretion system F family protein [Candidatus Nanopelagicales bacterium]